MAKLLSTVSFTRKLDGKLKNKVFIEYIFTKPAWRLKTNVFKARHSHSAQNPYGHSAVRYKNDNIDTVMNISGIRKDPMVNFIDPETYFFMNSLGVGNQQGGIYNRSFVTIRIPIQEPQKIDRLHNFYLNLDKDNRENKVGFTLAAHIIKNWFGKSNTGNCSYWTGLGLTHINIMNKTSSFPLVPFFRLLISTKPEEIDVIAYRSLKYKSEPKGAYLYPFYWLKNNYTGIWNLDKFANIIVQPKLIDEEHKIYDLEIMENNKSKRFRESIINKLKSIV